MRDATTARAFEPTRGRRTIAFHASALALGFTAALGYRLTGAWLAYAAGVAVAIVIGTALSLRLIDRQMDDDERIAAAKRRQTVLRMTRAVALGASGVVALGAVGVWLLLSQAAPHGTELTVAALTGLVFRLGGLGVAELALRSHEIDSLLARLSKRPAARHASGSDGS